MRSFTCAFLMILLVGTAFGSAVPVEQSRHIKEVNTITIPVLVGVPFINVTITVPVMNNSNDKSGDDNIPEQQSLTEVKNLFRRT